jgi:hypothetical protein
MGQDGSDRSPSRAELVDSCSRIGDAKKTDRLPVWRLPNHSAGGALTLICLFVLSMPFYYTTASSLSVRTLELLAAQPYDRLPTAGATHAAPVGIPYVPKHAIWLNMVEIEIGVLRSQCLDRRRAPRIGDRCLGRTE